MIMTEIKKAYLIAKEKSMDYELLDCTDIGKEWVFNFGEIDSEGGIIPGTPTIAVDKQTRKIRPFLIPPISNLKMLQKGSKVKIQDIL